MRGNMLTERHPSSEPPSAGCHFQEINLVMVILFSRLRVPKDALIPLTKKDESKLDSLLKRPYLTSQPDWQKEVRGGDEGKEKEESVT